MLKPEPGGNDWTGHWPPSPHPGDRFLGEELLQSAKGRRRRKSSRKNQIMTARTKKFPKK